MTTLKDLVQRAKDERQLSGRALAKLAQEHGHDVHSTQINHILAGTYKSRPTRTLLEAVAWLAGVPPAEAYKAAQLPLPGPPFADELPPDVDQLRPHHRAAVIGVIRAFLSDVDSRAEEPPSYTDPDGDSLSWEQRQSVMEAIDPGYAERALGDNVRELDFDGSFEDDDLAARQDPSSRRSRGQRERDELEGTGEHNQDEE